MTWAALMLALSLTTHDMPRTTALVTRWSMAAALEEELTDENATLWQVCVALPDCEARFF